MALVNKLFLFFLLLGEEQYQQFMQYDLKTKVFIILAAIGALTVLYLLIEIYARGKSLYYKIFGAGS